MLGRAIAAGVSLIEKSRFNVVVVLVACTHLDPRALTSNYEKALLEEQQAKTGNDTAHRRVGIVSHIKRYHDVSITSRHE